MVYLKILLCVILAIILCSICIYIIDKKSSKMNQNQILRHIVMCISAGNVIFIVLASLAAFKNVEGDINVIPFSGYFKAFKHINSDDLELIMISIITYIPLGIMLPFISKVKLPTLIISCAAFSILIKTLQLLLHRGIFDIDDVINNTLGIVIGYCIYKLISKVNFKRLQRGQANEKKSAV